MAAPDWATFYDPSGKYTLKYPGPYPVVEVKVSHNDFLRSEGGAMISMHPGVNLDFTREGGGNCMTSCLRMCCANESFFMNLYKPADNVPQGAAVDVLIGPKLPGAFILLHLNDDKWRVQPGAYLCSDVGVEMGIEFQGCAKGCCSGEGFVLLDAHGTGRLVLNAFGGILRYDLSPGEQRVVDNGQLVAWSGTMDYTIAKASPSLVTTCLSGEGFVCSFTGPGTLFIETRNIKNLAREVGRYLPSKPPEGGGEGGGA